MKRIRKGDNVIILSGKNKRSQGAVLSVQGDYATVEGVNIVKKHVKPNPAAGVSGGVIHKTMPLPLCKIALRDEHGKPSRIGIKIDENGKKVRFLKTTGVVIN